MRRGDLFVGKLWLASAMMLATACTNENAWSDFSDEQLSSGRSILINALHETDPSGKWIGKVHLELQTDPGLVDREAFKIRFTEDSVLISGGSGAGVLYGSQEAAGMLIGRQSLPAGQERTGSPAMKWRGISLQLMKLGEYNFAVTPEEFPFFYDRELWLEFLDFMATQRFNYIILWNGHPFDYFVKFDKYKEAQSGLSGAQIDENHDMLKWLIAEGGKRNIKFFFEFYNIHTSVYYQEAHGLPRELSIPTEELAAYTGYSISKFVSEFPEVGLFVTPGEGLDREYSDEWINNVIFKAIKSTGYTPTVFMRAWFFDLEHARRIVDQYPDLYFVRKFNVEMIADTRVDPENSQWAGLNGNFVVNIHLAANLEPFRWNPPAYIQSIVRNNITSGAESIQLHPRKAWRWPYGSDSGTNEYQWIRDTLFFTAWSRYAWDPDRDRESEEQYWLDLLTLRYGNRDAASHYLKSAEAGADVLPALQRLIWLGYDNHTIVTTGCTLEQLLASEGIPFLDLQPTLRIQEYITLLKSGHTIQGESPIDFLSGKVTDAEEALDEARMARALATVHRDELQRIAGDAEAIVHASRFYLHKVMALRSWVLLNEGIEARTNQDFFLEYLAESVEDYRELCRTTLPLYESVSDVPATHPIRLKKTPYHWNDLLVLYEKELTLYRQELKTEKSSEFYQPDQKGFAGIFYSNPGFVDLVSVEEVNRIDYDWDQDEEIGRHWSYKWLGFLKAPQEGPITVIVSSDRPVQVKLGKAYLELDTGVVYMARKEIRCAADSMYQIEISYNHEEGVGGSLKLEWEWEGHTREIVPGEYLYHAESQRRQNTLFPRLIEEMELK